MTQIKPTNIPQLLERYSVIASTRIIEGDHHSLNAFTESHTYTTWYFDGEHLTFANEFHDSSMGVLVSDILDAKMNEQDGYDELHLRMKCGVSLALCGRRT